MKLDLNRIAFLAAFLIVAVLVAFGKLPASYLAAIGTWLLPQPQTSKVPSGHTEGVDNSPEGE